MLAGPESRFEESAVELASRVAAVAVDSAPECLVDFALWRSAAAVGRKSGVQMEKVSRQFAALAQEPLSPPAMLAGPAAEVAIVVADSLLVEVEGEVAARAEPRLPESAAGFCPRLAS